MRSVVWGCNNTTCILLQLHPADLFELRSYDTTSKHTEMYEVKHSKFITTCWPANSSREVSMGSVCHGFRIALTVRSAPVMFSRHTLEAVHLQDRQQA